jgi:pyrimidine operon attenuation protein/uracil phosphoribosyltransferase
MRTLLSASEISTLIANLAQQILSDADIAATPPQRLAVVGVRRRGELIAQRLSAIMAAKIGRPVALGALDITMYRDDVVGKRPITIPIGTQMNFRLDDRVVILVDDVLFTGRSVRAALDALVDFGRPRLIRLAVLIERTGREYPVAANFVGRRVAIPPQDIVQVRLRPTDADDAVYIDESAASAEPSAATAQTPQSPGVAP